MATTVNYELKRGDYAEVPFAVVDSDGVPVNLTGVTIAGAYRLRGLNNTTAKSISIDDGIAIDNLEMGHGRIAFRHEMAAGIYDYDLQFDFLNAPPDRQTLMEGACTLTQDITP